MFKSLLQAIKVKLFLPYLRLVNLLSWRSILNAKGPAVSITSHGVRLDTVFLTLESIGRGNLRPSRLILWLDDPGEDSFSLPKSLLRLQKRGLEVFFCENFKPHNKYFHYLQLVDDFRGPLVTADDDTVFPRHWLEKLDGAYEAHPYAINCFVAHKIHVENGQIAPYVQWSFPTDTRASHLNFSLGVGGAIYPPRFLDVVKRAGREFLNCSPLNDDVWLNALAVRHGFPVRQLTPEARPFPTIPGTQAVALWPRNQIGNDEQIARTYTDEDVTFLVRCAEEKA